MTNRRSLLTAAALLVAGGLALALPQASLAADAASADGSIKITGSWTRATPAGAKVAGGFLTITNTGTQPDRLIGGSMVNSGKVEIHEMSMSDGVMKMAELAQGLEIKAGETVELKPGGYHMMFIDLTVPVKEGDKLQGTLVFQRAGTIKLDYAAAAIGAKANAGAAPAHGHMKH
jgi:periplasmic copper chaperone A